MGVEVEGAIEEVSQHSYYYIFQVSFGLRLDDTWVVGESGRR